MEIRISDAHLLIVGAFLFIVLALLLVWRLWYVDFPLLKRFMSGGSSGGSEGTGSGRGDNSDSSSSGSSGSNGHRGGGGGSSSRNGNGPVSQSSGSLSGSGHTGATSTTQALGRNGRNYNIHYSLAQSSGTVAATTLANRGARAHSFSNNSEAPPPSSHLNGDDDSPHNPPRRSSSLTRNSAQLMEQTEFHGAILNKDYYKIKNMLVDMPRLVKSVDEFQRTPLHIAADLGDTITTELLLQYNADINAVDSRHRTCLHMCSDDVCLRYLCDEGADISVTDRNGLLPLHTFTLSANLSCIRVLLEYDADPMVIEPTHCRNSLHLAANCGSFEVLSTMILQSRRVVDVNSPDGEGNSPLHIVCYNSNIIQPDGPTSRAETQNGSSGSLANSQLRSVMLLLDKGADVHLQNNRGITALHFACANRSLGQLGINSSLEPLIQILLELGAEVNCFDNDGCTPFLAASAYEQWSVCKILLEAGADMNLPCPISSFLLCDWLSAEKEKKKSTVDLSAVEQVTASDLMDSKMALRLFSSIRTPQTPIPTHSRYRCMNCRELLTSSPSSQSFSFSSGGYGTDCKHCNRVVCKNCVTKLPKSAIPEFITEAQFDGSVRVCVVCYEVLISDFIRTKTGT
jgi:ankyrin repeat protein